MCEAARILFFSWGFEWDSSNNSILIIFTQFEVANEWLMHFEKKKIISCLLKIVRIIKVRLY